MKKFDSRFRNRKRKSIKAFNRLHGKNPRTSRKEKKAVERESRTWKTYRFE